MGHALVGTLWMVGIAVVLTVPIGLVAAVYLDVTRSRPARFFRTVVEAMTALPSILAGLFIYASWILALGFQHSRAGRRPRPQRDDAPLHHPGRRPRPPPGARTTSARPSAALGRPGMAGRDCRWSSRRPARAWPPRSSWASPGPSARPPRCCSPPGTRSYINANPLHGPMVSLPLEALKLVQVGIPAYTDRAFGCASFLLLVVIVLFVVGPEDRRLGTGPSVRRGACAGSRRPRPATRPGSLRPDAAPPEQRRSAATAGSRIVERS